MTNRYDTEQLRGVALSMRHVAECTRTQSHRLSVVAENLRTEIAGQTIREFVAPGHLLAMRSLLAGIDARVGELAQLAQRTEDLSTAVISASLNAEEAETQARHLMLGTHDQLRSVLSSASFTALLRMLAGDIDLVSAGLTAGPLGALWQLVLGKPGPDYTASVLAAATRRSHHSPSALSVTQVGARTVAAPGSVAEMASRIPSSKKGEPQIVIERYYSRREVTWVVYYGGTIDMSLPSSDEPWDLRSNFEAMANTQSDSMRAAVLATERAGVKSGDRVVHVGFSQGGLIAAQIATQAPPNTASLITFGSPVSHLDLSGLRGVITAEHSEDLVPALSGFHATIGHDRHTILASAELGQQEQEMLPAHNMTRYTQTTERAELRGEAGLSREKVKIFAGFAGTGEASSWRSDRTPARQ